MKIITGTGRSGTSVTAMIFRDNGLNIGHKVHWYGYKRAGYEAPSVVKVNEAIINGVDGPHHYELMKRIEEDVDIVKDPRFTKTLPVWIKHGVTPEHVFICMREYEEVIRSAKETGSGIEEASEQTDEENLQEFLVRIGSIMYWVNKYDIPYTILRYEHFVEDWPEDVTGITKEYVKAIFKPRV